VKAILEVENLGVVFGSREILRDLNFEIRPGDCLAVIGPNGAGKTVLLKSLLNLVPYSGRIRWDTSARLGYVPQRVAQDRQLPIRVTELLRAKARVQKIPLPETVKVSAEVGLSREVLRSAIGTLSGGQWQKVLIALALLGDPTVMLFDEPAASLDELSEERIYDLVHSLQEMRGLTVILVSHELSVVYRYATTVLCLSKGKSCAGPPREILTPDRLAELYGAPSRYYAHVLEHEGRAQAATTDGREE
jgi:zinc transport system ATP-binding protein